MALILTHSLTHLPKGHILFVINLVLAEEERSLGGSDDDDDLFSPRIILFLPNENERAGRHCKTQSWTKRTISMAISGLELLAYIGLSFYGVR